MVKELIVSKKRHLTDADCGSSCNSYDILITEDTDCYYYDEQGIKQILCKFRKNVIPKEMSDRIIEIFKKHSMRPNNQRAMASGGKTMRTASNNSVSTKLSQSQISGAFDKAHMSLQKYFPSKVVCRTTAFTRDNIENGRWKEALPFFELIAKYYEHLAPEHYKRQMAEIKKVNKIYRIGKTPFTTITSNYNWRTFIHKDSGDYSEGCGNLVVLGKNFKGGYLIFPEFRLGVCVKNSDFLLMDVHQYHANSQLISDDINFRLSFVCYLRKNMTQCNASKIVNGDLYHYKSS